jgi:hypothetical protein
MSSSRHKEWLSPEFIYDLRSLLSKIGFLMKLFWTAFVSSAAFLSDLCPKILCLAAVCWIIGQEIDFILDSICPI